jgi:hypothetical protein
MIKILFLAANPKDTNPLRLGEETRQIKEKLRLAGQRDAFAFEEEHAVRVADLQGHLLHHQPHIVHFSGHGSKSGKIILENAIGRSKAVTSGALTELFSTLKDNVQCVVLNACYSEVQAKAIVSAIPCVVGMNRAIDDRSAIAFAASFYQGLGYGRSIKTAFDLGCGQINLQGLPGDDVPKLRVAPGVDAANLFLAKGGATASQQSQGKPKPAGRAAASPSSNRGTNPPVNTGRSSVFISYSHQDEAFAEKLYSRLKANGFDVWYAPANVRGGQKLHEQIGKAIQEQDRLLLVLSGHSMASEWVATEIRRARKAEVKEGKQKLFPIRLVAFDVIREWECFDADTGKDLGVEIREYFIPDFTKWTDDAKFEKAFDRLQNDLKTAE